MRIDLHLHTTASDGSLSPGALVQAARVGGLDIIAVTDHDTTAGLNAAVEAGAGTVHVIPGIELSTAYDVGEIHVLGYFIDAESPRLAAYAHTASDHRRDRMHRMIGRLGEIGVNVRYEEVLAAAGTEPESLGRPHLAKALVQRGYVSTFSEAFDRYIGNDGPAFFPAQILTPAEAISIIHEAGGLAVWAHPRPDIFLRSIEEFHALGLDGVECFRPRATPTESAQIEARTRELGMLTTGGSDWHGSWHGPLGSFCVTRDDVGAFLERGGI